MLIGDCRLLIAVKPAPETDLAAVAAAQGDHVVGMRVEDYYPAGKRWWVRLHEKGGKRHEMPADHKLEAFIDEYLAASGIRDEAKGPLFRSAVGRTGVLTACR
ncbi:MAG TPA: hypothetical protein VMF90_00275 [Rhizobiaceae bacterium]|nr:hypothetical protein [Rhizobiaceae bacterium]